MCLSVCVCVCVCVSVCVSVSYLLNSQDRGTQLDSDTFQTHSHRCHGNCVDNPCRTLIGEMERGAERESVLIGLADKIRIHTLPDTHRHMQTRTHRHTAISSFSRCMIRKNLILSAYRSQPINTLLPSIIQLPDSFLSIFLPFQITKITPSLPPR